MCLSCEYGNHSNQNILVCICVSIGVVNVTCYLFMGASRSLGLVVVLVLLSMHQGTRGHRVRTVYASPNFDASDITWAHAVNSRAALEKALQGDVDFLEADISIGRIGDDERQVPIMAHPPNLTSDISLEDWLDAVAASGKKKGIKLDFKVIEVVEPSLVIVQKQAHKLHQKPWLNADVLSGPVHPSVIPVQAETFLKLCKRYFPNAVLSLGWRTSLLSVYPQETWHYDWIHVRSMADVVRCTQDLDVEETPLQYNVTFPVRATFAARSVHLLQWLLQVLPGSSLTVWNALADPLDVDDLVHIRKHFPKHLVFYDIIQESLRLSFQKAKNKDAEFLPDETIFANGNWITLTRGEEVDASCMSHTYVTSNAVVFGQSTSTIVLLKDSFLLDNDKGFYVRGLVHLFEQQHRTGSSANDLQEVSLALVNASSFLNATLISDHNETSSNADEAWSVLNASRIYDFRYTLSPCFAFELNSSEDKSFQVWTLPCNDLYEKRSFEDLKSVGQQIISSRERLVLPSGPILLGLMSSGQTYASVYDLTIIGERETSLSAASSLINSALTTLVLLCLMLFII